VRRGGKSAAPAPVSKSYKNKQVENMDENKNTEKNINEVAVDTVSVSDNAPCPDDVADECAPTVAELAALKTEFNELNDKYLRTVAELENTRRRAALDIESRGRASAMNVAKQILPVMDAVQAAQKITPDDPGIKSMSRAIESAFAQIGITKIESVGQILNPQFHNAIQVVATDDAKPNTIVQEMQTGYMFGDTVLRTAMVVVSK